MKRITLSLLALSTLGMSSGNLLARGGDDDTPVNDEAKFTAADADASGGLSLAEFSTTFSHRTREAQILGKFTKADADTSGEVSLAEWLVFKDDSIPEIEHDDTAKFNAADLNDDGFLTLDEFATTVSKKPLTEVRKRFLKADKDDDSLVSLAEWVAYKNDKLPDDSGGHILLFDLADLDGDDALTPDEFSGAFAPNKKAEWIQKRFDKLDRNDDGVLTRDEWNPGGGKDRGHP